MKKSTVLNPTEGKKRLAEYYYNTAQTINDSHIYRTLDADQPQIKRMLEYMADRKDALGLALFSALTTAMVPYWSSRGMTQEQLIWCQQAAGKCTTADRQLFKAAHLRDLGSAYSDLSQMEQAIETYQQALAINRKLDDKRGQSADLGNIGNVYAYQGQMEQAATFYQQQLGIVRTIGDRRGEVSALIGLGNAYSFLGQVGLAIEYYEQALPIAREIGHRQSEVSVLSGLGQIYRSFGQVEQAILYYEQAIDIACEIGHHQSEVLHSWNLGLLYEETDPARAVALMSRLVTYQREIGHPNVERNAERMAQIQARV